MKTSRFSDAQIIATLNQAEAGSPVHELCREHGKHHLLQVACQIRWHGCFPHGPPQGRGS